MDAVEGCEVAISVLLEKMYIREFYAGVYTGVPQSTTSS